MRSFQQETLGGWECGREEKGGKWGSVSRSPPERNLGSIPRGRFGDSVGHSWVVPIRGQGSWSIYHPEFFSTGRKPRPKWYKFPGTSGLCREQTKQTSASGSHLTDEETLELADGTGYPVSVPRHLLLRVYLSIVSTDLSSVCCSHYHLPVRRQSKGYLNLRVSLSQPQSIPPQTGGHYESTEHSQLELRNYCPLQSCKLTQGNMMSNVVEDCLSGSSRSRRIQMI